MIKTTLAEELENHLFAHAMHRMLLAESTGEKANEHHCNLVNITTRIILAVKKAEKQNLELFEQRFVKEQE